MYLFETISANVSRRVCIVRCLILAMVCWMSALYRWGDGRGIQLLRKPPPYTVTRSSIMSITRDWQGPSLCNIQEQWGENKIVWAKRKKKHSRRSIKPNGSNVTTRNGVGCQEKPRCRRELAIQKPFRSECTLVMTENWWWNITEIKTGMSER